MSDDLTVSDYPQFFEHRSRGRSERQIEDMHSSIESAGWIR